MARNPDFLVNFTQIDRSAERARFSIHTAAQEDADAPSTELTDFIAAVATVCDGTILSYNTLGSKRLATGAYADAGNREDRWEYTYHDTVTLEPYTGELPCRKNTILPPTESDKVLLTAAPWANFKTKFEAFVRSPDGNPVVLDNVKLMGKNV